MKNGCVIVIGGPTGVGKTAACLRLARLLGKAEQPLEIINADSRQVYKGMEIGTAAPLPAEMQEVKHHFVSTLSPDQPFNAGIFERETLALCQQILPSAGRVIVAGGSGLYLKTFCEGMDELPADPAVRASLIQELHDEGLPSLAQRLQQADPVYAQQADLHNPQRVIRALEIITLTGQPFSLLRGRVHVNRPFRLLQYVLYREREELYDRINRRVEQMWADGLEEEGRKLLPFRHLNALQTVGYQELFGYFDGLYGREEAIRLMQQNTRRYAKRQLTWFRAQSAYEWVHADAIDELTERIQQAIGE